MKDRFLNPEARFLLSELNQQMAPRFKELNKALAELVWNIDISAFKVSILWNLVSSISVILFT